MKTLNVPYIARLHEMDMAQLSECLEQYGARIAIDSAPWSEYPYKPITVADIGADETHLVVKFFVRGLGLKANYSMTNEPVWQDSCVEVFIAEAGGDRYRNIEVNCIGTLLSAHQESRGINMEKITEDDAAKIIRHTSLERITFDEKTGLHQWEVAIAVPFDLLGYTSRPETLRANFYKCADGSRWIHYVSWAPIDTPSPDFHRPEFFGTLILQKP